MVQHFMVQNGLRKDDASFVGVGARASAVAAVQRGEIDAHRQCRSGDQPAGEPGPDQDHRRHAHAQGTRQVFGGPYPAAVLYAQRAFIEKNPRTMQALANAFVRGLKWMATHSPQEIAALMPEEYALGNKALYVQSITRACRCIRATAASAAKARRPPTRCSRRSIPRSPTAKIDVGGDLHGRVRRQGAEQVAAARAHRSSD